MRHVLAREHSDALDGPSLSRVDPILGSDDGQNGPCVLFTFLCGVAQAAMGPENHQMVACLALTDEVTPQGQGSSIQMCRCHRT